jgi:redox-sensitive bicupin YhaK (pirin superfamily)
VVAFDAEVVLAGTSDCAHKIGATRRVEKIARRMPQGYSLLVSTDLTAALKAERTSKPHRDIQVITYMF